jgi:hypothetical protein
MSFKYIKIYQSNMRNLIRMFIKQSYVEFYYLLDE